MMAKVSGTVYTLQNAFFVDRDGKKLELPNPKLLFESAKADIPAFSIRLDDIDLSVTFVCTSPLPLEFKRLFAPYTMTLAEQIAARMRSRISLN